MENKEERLMAAKKTTKKAVKKTTEKPADPVVSEELMLLRQIAANVHSISNMLGELSYEKGHPTMAGSVLRFLRITDR